MPTLTWIDTHEELDKKLWSLQKNIAMYDSHILRSEPEIAREYRYTINGIVKDIRKMNPSVNDVQEYCNQHGLSKTSARTLFNIILQGMEY